MTHLTPEQAANQLGDSATRRYWELVRAVEHKRADPEQGRGPMTPEENIAYWERLLDELCEEHRGKWLIAPGGEPMHI